MIPFDYITEWRAEAPWAMESQVEQDVILSRAVVSMFAEPEVANTVALRGGTALYKLHIRPPARYSEDMFSTQSQLLVHALDGRGDLALDLIARASLRDVARTDETSPHFLASCLVRIGETDEALEWVGQAIGWGFTYHRFMPMHNAMLAPLRGDPASRR